MQLKEHCFVMKIDRIYSDSDGEYFFYMGTDTNAELVWSDFWYAVQEYVDAGDDTMDIFYSLSSEIEEKESR